MMFQVEVEQVFLIKGKEVVVCIIGKSNNKEISLGDVLTDDNIEYEIVRIPLMKNVNVNESERKICLHIRNGEYNYQSLVGKLLYKSRKSV